MNLKKDLTEGAILEIYLYPFEEKEFRGNAVLLKRIKDDRKAKDKVFFFKEYLSRKKILKEYYCSYQTWIIRFIDGKDKGFKTQVKIPYKYKTQNKEDE